LSSDSLYRNFMFSSLQDMADTKDLLDGMIGYDFKDPAYWRRGWAPFLSNGGGSYMCLDTAAEDGGQPGQLVMFWKADKDRPIPFPNIETWLEGLLSAAEKGEIAN
jgi:cell wall assembly regulator SMI1